MDDANLNQEGQGAVAISGGYHASLSAEVAAMKHSIRGWEVSEMCPGMLRWSHPSSDFVVLTSPYGDSGHGIHVKVCTHDDHFLDGFGVDLMFTGTLADDAMEYVRSMGRQWCMVQSIINRSRVLGKGVQ